MDEEEKKKWMMMLLGSSLASEGICLFFDLWEAQPCLNIFDHAVCCKCGPKLAISLQAI